MKRSEINNIINNGISFCEKMNFKLPPFAMWSYDYWNEVKDQYAEIKDNMLGWGITDFGSKNFSKEGLLLLTMRNGNSDTEKYVKPYAEKLLIVESEQATPYHFHWNKIEDIINRGGGNLMVKVFNANEDGSEFLDTDVQVSMDGRSYKFEAGSVIKVSPGGSITLLPGQYHTFWGEKGKGTILIIEVSNVNNDSKDNRFFKEIELYSKIIEDEKPMFASCSDY